MSKQEQLNLLEYAYPDGATVQVPGRLLEGLLQIMQQVVESESSQGFIDSYPKTTKEVFKKEGESKFLEEVKVQWEQYPTAQSYFSQEPQATKTMLGVMTQDLLLLLQQIHLENIQTGVAKKIGTLKPKDEIKLSSEQPESDKE